MIEKRKIDKEMVLNRLMEDPEINNLFEQVSEETEKFLEVFDEAAERYIAGKTDREYISNTFCCQDKNKREIALIISTEGRHKSYVRITLDTTYHDTGIFNSYEFRMLFDNIVEC